MPLYFGYDYRLRPGFCIKCGLIPDEEHPLTKQKLQESLDEHHIIARMDGGSDTPENIASLCGSCHKEWHSFEMRSTLNFFAWTQIPPAFMFAVGFIAKQSMEQIGEAHREIMTASREFTEAKREYRSSPKFHYYYALGQSRTQKLLKAGVTQEQLESLGSIDDFDAFYRIVGRGLVARESVKKAWERFLALRKEYVSGEAQHA